MLILGFGNKARQGKDTAAEAIRDYYERDYNPGYMAKQPKVGTFKFATALYDEVNRYLSWYSVGRVGTWQNFSPELQINDGVYKNVMIPDWVQPDENPEVSDLAPYGKHPKLLQWWGTEFRRAQDPDYWTKKLFASIPANLDIGLVTDVRFPNEADGIKQRGGYNINIQRLHESGIAYYDLDRDPMHLSETALDGYNWDFYLKTKGNHVALLGEQAVTLAEYLRGLHG